MNEHYAETIQGKLLLALFHLHQVRSQNRGSHNLECAVAELNEANRLLGFLLGPDYSA